jgi:hypothetical protein
MMHWAVPLPSTTRRPMTIETAELTAQLNQARRQAQEAQDARRGTPASGGPRRGPKAASLLARLRAAWRGE